MVMPPPWNHKSQIDETELIPIDHLLAMALIFDGAEG